MKEITEILYWNGNIVGVISNAKVDNFDFYGTWRPTSDANLYRQFLEQVAEEGGARVDIGEVGSPLTGTVELEPDDQIEVKIRIARAKN